MYRFKYHKNTLDGFGYKKLTASKESPTYVSTREKRFSTLTLTIELVRKRANKHFEDTIAQTEKAIEKNKEQVEAANKRLKLFYTTH